MNALLDTALGVIPADSTIARLIGDVREWHAANDDWYAARRLIGERYGYDKYPGACHMVPNHALIILALLYGNGDFRRSLMIANTAGWDTDCNAGNVGAILGIRDGLAAFDDTPDYRDPVADRLYLSTAEGGRGISDALRETYRVVNTARALAGEQALAPKDGARFHFSLPGSVQGFMPTEPASASVTNTTGALDITLQAATATVTTPTFSPDETRPFLKRGYRLFASPTLYPGQEVVASLSAPAGNSEPITASLVLRIWDENDTLQPLTGPEVTVSAGESTTLRWTIPTMDNTPIQQVGLQIDGTQGDTLSLDALTWSGAPTVTLHKGTGEGDMWRQAWVDGVDIWDNRWPVDFQLSHTNDIGLIAQGTEEWQDYTVSATVRSPLAASAGIAARIGGMRRYYALVLREGGKAQIVKSRGAVEVLAETVFDWEVDHDYALALTVEGNTITGTIDGKTTLEGTDNDHPLPGGSAGFVVEVGTIVSGPITITAL
jgi:hypothetical protein